MRRISVISIVGTLCVAWVLDLSMVRAHPGHELDAPPFISDPEANFLAYQAYQVGIRCDRVSQKNRQELNDIISKMRTASKTLEGFAASGMTADPETARQDAYRLDRYIFVLRKHCEGRVFGQFLHTPLFRIQGAFLVQAARAAARDCDRIAYRQAIDELRRMADKSEIEVVTLSERVTDGRASVSEVETFEKAQHDISELRRLADRLERLEATAFRHCGARASISSARLIIAGIHGSDAARQSLEKAASAIRDCDRDSYIEAIAELRRRAAALDSQADRLSPSTPQQGGMIIRASELRKLADGLEAELKSHFPDRCPPDRTGASLPGGNPSGFDGSQMRNQKSVVADDRSGSTVRAPQSAAAPADSRGSDSDFYTGLAEEALETAEMARRTAELERMNVGRAQEAAKNWRKIAAEARRSGREDNAEVADRFAERAEKSSKEAEAAATKAEQRARNAEREANRFRGKADAPKNQDTERQEAQEAHEAVLVDPNTVFHRVYVLGAGDNIKEQQDIAADTRAVQRSLESAGKQAVGSTSTPLITPDKDDIRRTLQRLQTVAVPGDEITFYYAGHGGGGPFWGGRDLENEDNEKFEEHISINRREDVTDDELAAWLVGFAPGVSITVMLDSCFGGGFAGGSTDIQESDSVKVIGAGNVCPGGTDATLTRSGIVPGLDGAADSDSDGIITAEELKDYLLAKGWDIRAPYDDNWDLSLRELAETWWTGARISRAQGAVSDGAPDGEKKKATIAVLDSFQTVTGAKVTIVDANGDPVATATTEKRDGKSARAYFELPPGKYKAKAVYQNKTGEQEFIIGEGGDTTKVVVFVDEEGIGSGTPLSAVTPQPSDFVGCGDFCLGAANPNCLGECLMSAMKRSVASSGDLDGLGQFFGGNAEPNGPTGSPYRSPAVSIPIGSANGDADVSLERAVTLSGTSPVDERTSPIDLARSGTNGAPAPSAVAIGFCAPGSHNGNGVCGVGTTTATLSGSTSVTYTPFSGTNPATLNISGGIATGTATILGSPGISCSLNCNTGLLLCGICSGVFLN